jgi:hypothetical protein
MGNNKLKKKENLNKKIKILNFKNRLNECFGLFALIANAGADTFDRGFLCVSVPS